MSFTVLEILIYKDAGIILTMHKGPAKNGLRVTAVWQSVYINDPVINQYKQQSQ